MRVDPAAADVPRQPVARSFLDRSLAWYERTLAWALRHRPAGDARAPGHHRSQRAVVHLIPKGFFPQEDTGPITGGIVADQSISFQLMKDKLVRLMNIVQADPAVESVAGYTGAGSGGGGADQYRLGVRAAQAALGAQDLVRPGDCATAPAALQIPGGRLFLQTVQDIRVGGRQSNAQFQFTLQADKVSDLNEWGPKLLAALQDEPRGGGRQFRSAAERSRDRRDL